MIAVSKYPFCQLMVITCLLNCLLLTQSTDDDTTTFPSSCRDLDDGAYSLKLVSGDLDDSPIVNLQCDNGYTILDISKDSNLESYFNSFKKYHHSVAGPDNDNKVNWEGWYKADDGNTNYLLSPDCNTCEESHTRQIFSSKTAYMMTGTLFGCFWNLKGDHNFDQDYDSYQCYYSSGERNANGKAIRHELNEESSIDDWDLSGVCAFSVRSSERDIPNPMTHDACTVDLTEVKTEEGDALYDVSDTYHLKPSIGTNGEFCVCVQPSGTEYFEIRKEELTEFNNNNINNNINEKDNSLLFQEIRETIYNSETNTYELYQNDFQDGTYRIQTPGTYKIMENIEFDFNYDYEHPNSDTAWWPTTDQNDVYPGAGGYSDSYFLGFFAGITVESNDVVLDLNDKILKMSDVFYHQQRWFTTISLTSQYFLPGQGIGFFGANPWFAENIIIKNGVLGLSSHHGIHGHFNKNILIENVWVKDFETHGIQFNGFDGVTINNCEIGPTSEQSYFKGEYGHVRTLLKRFKNAAMDNPDTSFQFYNRKDSVTMSDIVDELETQVNMAYNYIVNNVEYDENDESWQSAKSLFIDDTNLPNGAAMYGIFLNTYGASVLTYNLDSYFFSNNAIVSNTKIHGLKHAMAEYVRIQYPDSGNLFMNPLHAPFDASQILGDLSNLDNPRYFGSIITDACIALEKLETNNWNYLQAQLTIDNNLLDWAFGEGDLSSMDNIVIGCNTDAMIHSGKGINGLRIDGVNNVLIDNVDIFDISEQTPLGKEICGNYETFDGMTKGYGGGHFRQTLPMQTGFSGTMLQGININAASNIKIKDIKLSNLESYHGPVFGVSIWPATNVIFEGSIMTTLFNAGKELTNGKFSYEDRPNFAPEVCAIRMYESYERDGETYVAIVNDESVNEFDVSCMQGHVSCLGSDDIFTHFGSYVTSEDVENECNWNNNNNKRSNILLNSANNGENVLPPRGGGGHNDKNHEIIHELLNDTPKSIGGSVLSNIFLVIFIFALIIAIVSKMECCKQICNHCCCCNKDNTSEKLNDYVVREQLIDHKNSEYGSVCLGY